MPDLRTAFDFLCTAVEGATGLTQSPYPIDPEQVSANQSAGFFSLDWSTVPHPEGPGRWRDSGRVRNTVTITSVRAILPKAQIATQRALLDDQDSVMNAVMGRTAAWQQSLTVMFVDASQAISTSREWMISRMRFTVDHYVELT